MKNAGFRIRVEDQLRARFIEACKRKDVPAAQVVREFMRTYIEASERDAQLPLFSEPQENVANQ